MAAGDSDCMWVVERSKLFLSANDKHAARAWMLTARSLYPHQFIVQACKIIRWFLLIMNFPYCSTRPSVCTYSVRNLLQLPIH